MDRSTFSYADGPNAAHHQNPPADKDSDLVGVGLCFVLSSNNNNIKVKQVIPGGSADRASAIKVGDRLIAVDPEGSTSYLNVVGMDLAQLKPLLLGKEGTLISLELDRGGSHYFVRLLRGEKRVPLPPHQESPERRSSPKPANISTVAPPVQTVAPRSPPRTPPARTPPGTNNHAPLREIPSNFAEDQARLNEANRKIVDMSRELQELQAMCRELEHKQQRAESHAKSEELRRTEVEHREDNLMREIQHLKQLSAGNSESRQVIADLQAQIAALEADRQYRDADDKTLLSRVTQDAETIDGLLSATSCTRRK